MSRAVKPKFPDITVQLTGMDGNGFMIVGRVRVAMRKAGVSHFDIDQFATEAMSGDYERALDVVARWVTIQW